MSKLKTPLVVLQNGHTSSLVVDADSNTVASIEADIDEAMRNMVARANKFGHLVKALEMIREAHPGDLFGTTYISNLNKLLRDAKEIL